MKQETNDKLKAIFEAAAKKAADKNTPKFTEQKPAQKADAIKPAAPQKADEKPAEYKTLAEITAAANAGKTISLSNLADLASNKPQPAPATPAKLALMESFLIVWHEGTGEYDGRSFATWHEADRAFMKIYQHEAAKNLPGYTKVKICVKWENGETLNTRVDVSNNAGDYSSKRETIETYLKRRNPYPCFINCSFSDDDAQPQQPAPAPTPAPDPKPAQPAAPELSQLTFADLMKPAQEETPAAAPLCAPASFEIKKATDDAQPQTAPQAQKAPKFGLKLIPYSDKSFAVTAEEKLPVELLEALYQYGSYNRFLKCGKGWIFSNKRLEQIKTLLAQYL